MLFSARNLCKRYAAGTRGCSAVVRVLAGVDLELVPGQIVGVVGERGTGKTTLLRCVAGLARADFGTLHWAPAADRSRITALAPAAHPYETVRDVVSRACGESLVSAERLGGALADLGLVPLMARSQVALTTDERARVALAIGIATRHPILLLDGTADAFAATARPLVRACLDSHAASGGAVLLAGRDRGAVSALADTVWELAEGRLRPPVAPDARPIQARVAERRNTPSVR